MSRASQDPKERLLKFVDTEGDGCWLWKGKLQKDGYGSFYLNGRPMNAHRAAYILLEGPVPPKKHLHHDRAIGCVSKACVRPSHMQMLDIEAHSHLHRDDVSASNHNRRKTHCPHGHEYTPENTLVSGKNQRFCRTCTRERGFQRYRDQGREPGKGRGWQGRAVTHCPKGHPYDEENTRHTCQGKRMCKTCKRASDHRCYVARRDRQQE